MLKHGFLAFLLLFLLIPGVCRSFDLGSLNVHGFASQGYLWTTDNDYLAKTERGSTEFNDVAINVSSELSDRLRVGFQFLARDLGDAGNDKANLDWGYGDYRFRDGLGLRVGKVKRPMGLYNEGRDVDLLRTFILLPQSVYREDMRDIMNAAKGAAVYGTIPAASLGSFDYQHVYGSKDLDLESVALRRQFLNRFPGVDVSDIETNVRFTDTTHVFWNSPVKGLRMGLSYEVARLEACSPAVPDIPTSDPGVVIEGQPARTLRIDLDSVWVASVEYRRGDLMLTAEYIDTVQKFTMDSGPEGRESRKSHSLGYYGGIDYRFTPWLEVGAYYSVYYPNKHDRDGSTLAAYGMPDYMGWQKDACLSFRFDPVPGWTCKVEGHYIDGAAQVFDYRDPQEVEDRWGLFAAKVTFSF